MLFNAWKTDSKLEITITEIRMVIRTIGTRTAIESQRIAIILTTVIGTITIITVIKIKPIETVIVVITAIATVIGKTKVKITAKMVI